jgi:glucokinase
VVEDGPLCGCGNYGCLETLAGARAIAAAAERPSFDDVVVSALRGDERAREAIRRAAAYIGIAVANLTIFIAPERIVVGGGVAEAGELLFDPLRAEVERRVGRVAPLHAIDIVPATLGADAGAVGAALAAS